MKAKFKVLAALSHKAELLILDEPTVGLDVIARDEVLNMLREFMEENQFYTTGMNRVTRRVNPHIITIEDVKKYAKRKNSQ